MGMAASQARLLTITSRLHDVELKAQNIENQKIVLATQKDGAWYVLIRGIVSEKGAPLASKKCTVQNTFNATQMMHL